MPPTRRSETAPRKSSRVSALEKDKAARDQARQDAADAEKKKAAAAERKKQAEKSKRKKSAAKRRTTVAKRKAPAKAEEEDEESEEPKEKKARKAPTKRGEKKDGEEEEAKDEAAAEADEPAKVEGGKYKIGDVVEDIKLQNEDDKEISLADLYKEQGLVIFSYPKASTPGCTTQACNFRDTASAFASHSFTVLGLSRDKPSAQTKFKANQELGYSLLSDPDAALLKRLGATESQKRCHWVIEKGGKLLEAKIGVKPADDAKNALKFVEGLSGKKTDDDKEEQKDEKEEK